MVILKFVWNFSDPEHAPLPEENLIMEVPRTGGPIQGKEKKRKKNNVTIGVFFAGIRIHIFISIIKNQQLKK